MRLVRVALASVNATVGACRSNVDRAIAVARAAAADGATLVALPEQVIGGYPPEDLVQWRAFVDAQQLGAGRASRARRPRSAAPRSSAWSSRAARTSTTCAALVHAGRVWGLRPQGEAARSTTSSTRRARWRAGRPGLRDAVDGVPFGDLVFELDFGTVALEVCEDGWSPDGPMRRRSFAGAELVVNLSASPFRVGIAETRREMIATRAPTARRPSPT